MFVWKINSDKSCWKYSVWYFMPTVTAQAQFTYRAADKRSNWLPIFELFSFRFSLCCSITLALSCIWLQTSKSFSEGISALKNVILILHCIASRLMSFTFKKNKLFLRMLKIADFFLREKSEEDWSFLPFILYLEMALAYLQIALFKLTEAKGQGRKNIRLRVLWKENAFFLKYLVLACSKLCLK